MRIAAHPSPERCEYALRKDFFNRSLICLCEWDDYPSLGAPMKFHGSWSSPSAYVHIGGRKRVIETNCIHDWISEWKIRRCFISIFRDLDGVHVSSFFTGLHEMVSDSYNRNRPAGLTPHERRRQKRPFSCMYSTWIYTNISETSDRLSASRPENTMKNRIS